MFSKVMWVSAMLACISNAQCSAKKKKKNYTKTNKIFEKINAAEAFSGEKPIAPVVKSED